MRTKLFLLVLIALLFSCDGKKYDDILDKQNSKLSALEARLKKLEDWTTSVNTDIVTLKQLTEALNKKVSVVSYKELEDKSGYELTMSDGSSIVLKNGKDGKSPVVGVKLGDDGVYYWTVNGEWMLDGHSNKIPTTGKDGKDGVTPKLRVNRAGNWEVSLDGGVSWQEVKDANGNPVAAKGDKGDKGDNGDANLTITETDTAIIIVYKGVTYTIPKGDANAPITTNKMILTTTNAVGEGLFIRIDAAESDRPSVWIDINNNGVKDSGEAVTKFGLTAYSFYELGSSTITIYGKVTYLYCNDNRLTSLDVSKNTALTQLSCSSNQLSSLDVSNNTKLERLSCSHNQLSSLDVSKNTALTQLSCSSNPLSSLDISANTALKLLACYSNQLTSLDLSKNTELESLWTYRNPLISLDISANTALKLLSCHENQLSSLDVSNNTKLERLSCSSNQLTSLDVSANKRLRLLWCESNDINGANMTALINSLHNDKSISDKTVVLKHKINDKNKATVADIKIATDKGWKVQLYDGKDYSDYAGE